MADRVVGCFPLMQGYTLREARVVGHRVQLQLIGRDGNTRSLTTDHVVAATGYRPELRRLGFLSTGLLDQLTLLHRTPVFSSQFGSCVPGLYFTGPISATSFGPVVRFAVGAKFAARRITRHLAVTSPVCAMQWRPLRFRDYAMKMR